MIIRIYLLVAGFLTLATGAFAQIDPDPDGIGVYFDLEATQVSTNAAVGETVTAYLIATNTSQAGGLAFWEAFVFSFTQEVIIWGDPENGVNLAGNMPPGGPGFAFVVASNSPLPPLQSLLLLATLSITVLTEEPTDLMILGFSYEFPMYRVDDLYGSDHFWYPSSGDAHLPVAMINGEAPVSVEPRSWGGVKSLFR